MRSIRKLYSSSWFNPVIPLLLWAAFALLPFLFPQSGPVNPMNDHFRINMFYRNVLILVLFYVHAYGLYPLLRRSRGLVLYIAGIAILFCCYVVAAEELRPKPNFFDAALNSLEREEKIKLPANMFPQRPMPFDIFFSLPAFVFAIFTSYFYAAMLHFNTRERSLNERENEQLKTELNFLRSQISPHFMFNVLNSMVSLARKKSSLLEPSLINMSNLLRYMLYERNEDLISLKTEIEYLRNYIDLQLLRYGDTVKLNMYVNGNFESRSIEPMLLIPFVENAFKHGISVVEAPLIDIFLTVNDNRTLQFVVINNISPVSDMQEGESGIGLQNIRRRLELLYPGKHILNISQEDEIYKAELVIKLS